MSNLGDFQGQWLGKWQGDIGSLPPGFIAGNAVISISAIGTLSDVTEPAKSARGRHQISFQQARDEWENRKKWRERVLQWADVEPIKPKPKKKAKPAEIPVQEVLPRLTEPVLSLAELVEDANLLHMEQAQALEAAIVVRDVMALAELAYLTELAVQQEKEAVLAFVMFME